MQYAEYNLGIECVQINKLVCEIEGSHGGTTVNAALATFRKRSIVSWVDRLLIIFTKKWDTQ
jgi:hypothetical protein